MGRSGRSGGRSNFVLKSIFVESIYVEKGPSERTTNLDGHELAARELAGRPLVRLQCCAAALARLDDVGSEAPQRGVLRAGAPYLRLRRKTSRVQALTSPPKKSGPVCLSSPNRATESPESCKLLALKIELGSRLAAGARRVAPRHRGRARSAEASMASAGGCPRPPPPW